MGVKKPCFKLLLDPSRQAVVSICGRSHGRRDEGLGSACIIMVIGIPSFTAFGVFAAVRYVCIYIYIQFCI